MRGFEPPTPSSRTKCATRLRYIPKDAHYMPKARRRTRILYGAAVFPTAGRKYWQQTARCHRQKSSLKTASPAFRLLFILYFPFFSDSLKRKTGKDEPFRFFKTFLAAAAPRISPDGGRHQPKSGEPEPGWIWSDPVRSTGTGLRVWTADAAGGTVCPE